MSNRTILTALRKTLAKEQRRLEQVQRDVDSSRACISSTLTAIFAEEKLLKGDWFLSVCNENILTLELPGMLEDYPLLSSLMGGSCYMGVTIQDGIVLQVYSDEIKLIIPVDKVASFIEKQEINVTKSVLKRDELLAKLEAIKLAETVCGVKHE